MLAELFDRIVSMGREAQAPTFATHHDLPDLVVLRDGETVHHLDVPPPRRHHTILGLLDLMRACLDNEIAPHPEIYHDSERIVCLLDRYDRRQTVHMPLIRSARFAVLEGLSGHGRGFTVRDAVKCLRYQLHGTGVETVIQALRRVDFTRTGSGTADVRHGKESLGRAVEAAVQQADSIPEEFVVTAPVYTNAGLRDFTVKVRVGIYLDVDAERIELATMADELEAAQVTVQRMIHEALVENLPAPIFHGAP